eukprot:COSAG06_NODE_34921_length_467_cov_0.940217_1_plen_114_part_10
MSLHSGADGSVTVGGAGVGAGGITGGSEMETVSGAWMVAATSAGELSTAAPAKPLEVAASFTASMMADANVVADAPPAATSARAALTLSQLLPQVITYWIESVVPACRRRWSPA